ncbi:hypothetical protein Scep_000990 [Stephania cephalantha]|uniref:ubiquitinyl hydrolase 1 n=1 Tax=Stephania cephalantha TaxID=152367 RepID=A0AAP0LAX3_9MAGN
MDKMSIYHEKQRLQFCLLHALNNLFQAENSFTRADLDGIAAKLSLEDPYEESNKWNPLSVIFKPHHNSITGNYDINVLIAVLEARGKRVVWHDRRNGASLTDLDVSNEVLMGIVLNIPVRRLAGIWRSRHWVALRKVEGIWYNLDSDLSSPLPFNDTKKLKDFLDGMIANGSEVFLLMELSKSLRRRARLPEISWEQTASSYKSLRKEESLGELGETMVGILPNDLPFTVFVPSEKAFKRDLRLLANGSSLVGQSENANTFAILSRLMGFAAVPRSVFSNNIPIGKELTLYSISGFKLHVSRESNGMVVTNGIRSEQVDLKRMEIVVHVMDGAIMDADMEQSVQIDDEDSN